MTSDRFVQVPVTRFTDAGVRERNDLQRLLREQIDVVVPDVLVIAEEFGDFEGARRRIDLLGLDRDGRLVVIELKRTEDGGHMELQALRYAAMVSAMTFEEVVRQRQQFASGMGAAEEDSESIIVDWLSGQRLLADDVRIVLVSADFGVELTTTVLWLTQRYELDILCIRLVPHQLEDRLLLDVQQVLPLREARDYQVGLRRRDQETREVLAGGRDFTRYQLVLDGVESESLAKQQSVKRAVRFLVDQGVPVPLVRQAVGNRWRAVTAGAADEVPAAFEATHGRGGHWWFDMPLQDDPNSDEFWVMLRVGGLETEAVLSRLQVLLPQRLQWRRAGE